MTNPSKSTQSTALAQPHRWTFYRCGGVNQVLLSDATDLANLDQLDRKLWMALAMPRAGMSVDPATFSRLDTDEDGTLRPPEILEAVRWTLNALQDANLLFTTGDSIPLSAIRDPNLLSCARKIFENQHRPDANEIHLADVTDLSRIFINTRFNGDGIVPSGSAENDEEAQAIEAILGVLPGTPDRCGKPGLDAPTLNRFFTEALALCNWVDELTPDPTIEAAAAAILAVQAKVDDFFLRCRLAAFDPRAADALNRQPADYGAITAQILNGDNDAIAGFPLAAIAPNTPLPLSGPVNPVWSEPLTLLSKTAVTPLLGSSREALSEADWALLKSRIADYATWKAKKPQTSVEALGLPRLRELLAGDLRVRLEKLIEQDASMREEYERVSSLEKLVRYRRDLHEILTNTVNFADFYGQTLAIFQAGVLYLDARACSLCIEVTDPARHASLAGLSGAFLAYCDLTRPGGLKKTIVAAITNGDSDNLMVGRNGIFYDREGRDWNATVTKIVSNPISVREAFWLPYKKLVRMIEDQIAKRAQAADAASTAKMSDTATQLVTAPPGKTPDPPRKIDLGTIALIGTAIGGISALVGGFLQMLFGMGFWLPLGVLGMLMLISGPSMLLASMKLRQRNLGPLLDASGWAINTKARINIPFGTTLTQLAELPKGSKRMVSDPFSDKRRHRSIYGLLLLVILAASFWSLGRLDYLLPKWAQRNRPVTNVAPVVKETVTP